MPDSQVQDSTNMCPDTTSPDTGDSTMTRVKPMHDDEMDSLTISDFSKLKEEVNKKIYNMVYDDFFSKRLDEIRSMLDMLNNNADSQSLAPNTATDHAEVNSTVQEPVNSADQETVNISDHENVNRMVDEIRGLFKEIINSTDQETVNSTDQETVNSIAHNMLYRTTHIDQENVFSSDNSPVNSIKELLM